jgi:hypothetical protein
LRYIFPSLLPRLAEHHLTSEALHSIWPDEGEAILVGRRYVCADEGRSIPHTLFTKLLQAVSHERTRIVAVRADAVVIAWNEVRVLVLLSDSRQGSGIESALNVVVLALTSSDAKNALSLMTWVLADLVGTFFETLQLTRYALCREQGEGALGVTKLIDLPLLGNLHAEYCETTPHAINKVEEDGRALPIESIPDTFLSAMWEGGFEEIDRKDHSQWVSFLGESAHLLADPRFVTEDVSDNPIRFCLAGHANGPQLAREDLILALVRVSAENRLAILRNLDRSLHEAFEIDHCRSARRFLSFVEASKAEPRLAGAVCAVLGKHSPLLPLVQRFVDARVK